MKTAAALIVFIGGFIIMVARVVGARFLAKDFGSSFHVWVSQIGVVLVALAVGYYAGGALADRWQRLSGVAVLLVPAWPWRCADSTTRMVDRENQFRVTGHHHPAALAKARSGTGQRAISFLLPCIALATLSPYMIRSRHGIWRRSAVRVDSSLLPAPLAASRCVRVRLCAD